MRIGTNMSDPKGNSNTVYKKPEMLGMCTSCGEYTDAYEPCCNAAVSVEGGNEHWEELQSEWEHETGLSWEKTFG